MIVSTPPQARTILAALTESGLLAKPAGYGRWRSPLTESAADQLDARWEEDWLLLDAPLYPDRTGKQPTAETLWRMLECNAHLPGSGKLALPPGSHAPHFRSEVPLDCGIDLTRRMRQFHAGLRKARLPHLTVETRPLPYLTVGTRPDVDWSALCREAGWSCTQRANGRLAIALDVPDSFSQAFLEAGADYPSLSVELATDVPPAPCCRHALAVLLLSLGAIIRMVRPATADREGTTALFWEAPLSESPSPTELANALSALSLACRLSEREVKVLQKDVIAEEYLSARGWSPDGQTPRAQSPVRSDPMTTATGSLAFQASDVSGQKTLKLKGVPADASVGEVIQSLLPRMRLPPHDVEGRPLTYQVHLEREGRHLHASETVGDALQEDDHIVLQPNIMAG